MHSSMQGPYAAYEMVILISCFQLYLLVNSMKRRKARKDEFKSAPDSFISQTENQMNIIRKMKSKKKKKKH